MTAFDLVALLIVSVSALIGFSRGAVREVITVFAFTVAALLALYALPVTAPLARRLVHPPWLGAAAAVVVVFICAYVALRVLGSAITSQLEGSALGGANRLAGAGFGALRALVLVGAFALVFNAVTPRGLQPAWITGGFTWPVARGSGLALAAFAPAGLSVAGGLGKAVGEGVKKGLAAGDAAPAEAADAVDTPDPPLRPAAVLRSTRHPQAYGGADRMSLNRLVERAR